jgi:hypothetical protein
MPQITLTYNTDRFSGEIILTGRYVTHATAIGNFLEDEIGDADSIVSVVCDDPDCGDCD